MTRGSRSWSTRVVGRALRLLPADLRRAYGEEMVAVYADREQRLAVERGRVAAARYLARTLFNIVVEAGLSRLPRQRGARGAAESSIARDFASALALPGWRDDLRYVVRSLRRSWGFTCAAVAILGAGLGLTTAVFSIFYGILLRPLPYREPDALIRIDWAASSGQTQASTLREWEQWRDGARTVSSIGAFSSSSADVRADGPAETAQVAYVTGDTLAMLGVSPYAGRLFDRREDVPNGDVHKAILSYELWTRLFQQRPDAVGRTIRQGDSLLEIVGVMPPGFGFPNRTDLWVPIESVWARSTRAATQRLTVRSYSILARLTDPGAVAAARHELQAIATAGTGDRADAVLRLRSLRDAETGQLRPYLIALLGGVFCLALICITNVASLQLARGTARAREFAVRAAIGASAPRNLRLQFIESGVLATMGALVASAVAVLALRLVVASIPTSLPAWMRLDVDPVALSVALALAIVTSVMAGLLSLRPTLDRRSQSLLRGGRGTTDRAVLRKGLVVGEIALSTALLLTASLLIQTLLTLQQRATGFRPEGILAVQVSRAHSGAPEARARTLPAVHGRVLERLAAVPGVVQVAATNRLPLTAGAGSRMIAALHVTGVNGASATRASFFGSADVTPAYFTTMGIPLLGGRAFSDKDDVHGRRVVIVNERAARQLWPGEEALGQQVTWGTPRPDNPPATVVGIVGNLRAFAAEGDAGLDFYYPYAQYPVDNLFYVIRTSVEPGSLAHTMRQLVQEMEPSIAVSAIKTMPQRIDEALWQPRLWGWLFGLFAATALLLAAAGLYSLVSYLTALRAKEMSIRMSLGATGEQIVRLVLGGMCRLIALGVLSGIAVSLAVSRLLAAVLFEVSATDVRFHVIAATIVAGVTLLACCPPIFRSRRLDLSALFSGD